MKVAFRPSFLIVLLLGPLVVGCQQAVPGPLPLVTHLIKEPPNQIFDPSMLKEFHSSVELSFLDKEELSSWTPVEPLTLLGDSDRGVTLKLSTGSNVMTRDVNVDAADIEVVRIRGRDFEELHFQLHWATEDGGSSSEEQLSEDTRSEDSSGDTVVEFRVAGADGWRGEIIKIGLVVSALRDQYSSLRDLSMGTVRGSQSRIANVIGKPWLFDDGGTPIAMVRSGILSSSEHPLSWTVEVPMHADLQFGVGMANDVDTQVTYRVLARSTVGGQPSTEELWKRESSGTWHETQLDLGALAGRKVSFIFETEHPNADDRPLPLVAWTNPEIIVRQPSTRPSLFLASIDTLRADRLSLYGSDHPTSPHIDRWASQSATTFETAIAPSSWTLPSHVSLFTGLNAHHHGVNGQFPAPLGLSTMAEMLRAAGWATVAVTGGGFLHPRYGLTQGFDEYGYWNGPGDHADELESETSLALSILAAHQRQARASGRPFFFFFHTYEVHYPYRAREPFFGKWSRWPEASTEHWKVTLPRENDRLTPKRLLPTRNYYLEIPGEEKKVLPEDMSELPRDLYDSSVAFMDAHFSRLLDALRSDAANDDTMIVFTSDHGEMLGEHDLRGHTTLYEENVRIPLVIDLPGPRSQEKRVKRQVGLVDVLPTALDVLGLEVPPGIDGASLLPLINGSHRVRPREVFMYSPAGNHGFGIRLQNTKFILRDGVWPPHRGRRELYRLDQDPNEENPLSLHTSRAAAFRREAIRQLHQTAGFHIRFSNNGPSTLTGILEAPGLTPSLKSVDLSCDCLVSLDHNRTRFKVPVGASFGLYSSQIRDAAIRIILEPLGGSGSDEGTAFVRSFSPQELQDLRTLRWNGSDWSETTTDVGRSDSTTVRLFWLGPSRTSTTQPSAATAQSRRQLKALGYVE